MTTLLTISGALRKGSFNRKLLAVAARYYEGAEVVEADLHLPLYDGDLEAAEGIPAEVQRLADQIRDAESVVISSPEYNKMFTGVLKNALDWVSRTEGNPWFNKPVAIMSASPSREGGARSQFLLRLALAPFQPRLINAREIMVAQAHKEFDEDDGLANEFYHGVLKETMALLKAEATR